MRNSSLFILPLGIITLANVNYTTRAQFLGDDQTDENKEISVDRELGGQLDTQTDEDGYEMVYNPNKHHEPLIEQILVQLDSKPTPTDSETIRQFIAQHEFNQDNEQNEKSISDTDDESTGIEDTSFEMINDIVEIPERVEHIYNPTTQTSNKEFLDDGENTHETHLDSILDELTGHRHMSQDNVLDNLPLEPINATNFIQESSHNLRGANIDQTVDSDQYPLIPGERGIIIHANIAPNYEPFIPITSGAIEGQTLLIDDPTLKSPESPLESDESYYVFQDDNIAGDGDHLLPNDPLTELSQLSIPQPLIPQSQITQPLIPQSQITQPLIPLSQITQPLIPQSQVPQSPMTQYQASKPGRNEIGNRQLDVDDIITEREPQLPSNNKQPEIENTNEGSITSNKETNQKHENQKHENQKHENQKHENPTNQNDGSHPGTFISFIEQTPPPTTANQPATFISFVEQTPASPPSNPGQNVPGNDQTPKTPNGIFDMDFISVPVMIFITLACGVSILI